MPRSLSSSRTKASTKAPTSTASCAAKRSPRTSARNESDLPSAGERLHSNREPARRDGEDRPTGGPGPTGSTSRIYSVTVQSLKMDELDKPMTGDDCRAELFADHHRAPLKSACAEDGEIWQI